MHFSIHQPLCIFQLLFLEVLEVNIFWVPKRQFGFFASLSTNVDWKSVSVECQRRLSIYWTWRPLIKWTHSHTTGQVVTPSEAEEVAPPFQDYLTILPFSWPQNANYRQTLVVYICWIYRFPLFYPFWTLCFKVYAHSQELLMIKIDVDKIWKCRVSTDFFLMVWEV